jgi:hypothetical protein
MVRFATSNKCVISSVATARIALYQLDTTAASRSIQLLRRPRVQAERGIEVAAHERVLDLRSFCEKVEELFASSERDGRLFGLSRFAFDHRMPLVGESRASNDARRGQGVRTLRQSSSFLSKVS